MKKILFILMFLSTYLHSANTVYTTIGGPTWTTNANWGGGTAPDAAGGANNTYNINNSMTVTSAFTLGSNSILTLCNTCTLTINGDVTFANGSTLNVPAGANLIINGNVINNNNSNNINIDGLITINGNFTGGNGSAVVGTGAMAITGTATTEGTGTIFDSTVDCNTAGTCDNSAQDPLPIELLSFDAFPKVDFILLTWSTASEINNDYFTIERSKDAIYFEVVVTLTGAGNSTSVRNYSILDTSPYRNVNYYRLRQTDYDGKTEVSPVIAIALIDYIKDLRVVRITNLLGEDVDEGADCIKIYYYNDGSIIKKYRFISK